MSNIIQVYVALDRILIPLEHRVDGLCIFRVIRLVDAACIDPKVLETIGGSLLSAKEYFLIPYLASIRLARDIFKGHLVLILPPIV
jgi:hypothetical protein